MDQSKVNQVKHLYAVERLSMKQIAKKLHMCTKTISRILRGEEHRRKRTSLPLLHPFGRLVELWYREYPFLKATQVYERLKPYGYTGSYETVCLSTRGYREKKKEAYHELEYLAGEEVQIDWMEATLPFGKVYGFVFILAYSRYLFVRFYPRSSFEFFLDGHIEAMKEINGVARRHKYDNLKSAVIERKPELKLNPQLLDFARHCGFSIYACTPGRPNEKGRVERVIRDIRGVVETNAFTAISDLNTKVTAWRKERNERIHRVTNKTPSGMLTEENLKPLPALEYKPYRVIPVSVSVTAFIEFETNRYSVPTDYAGMAGTILAYPEHIEIVVKGAKVAHHARAFGRREKSENPSHRIKLLYKTPNFKEERIYQLMKRMDAAVARFLDKGESEGEDVRAVAHGLFRLLRENSKEILLSAIREALGLNIHKLRYIESLLRPGVTREESPVYPQNARLLDISYERRELAEYDELI